jgi:hypothetical protein
MKQGKPTALFTRMALALGSIFGGFRSAPAPAFDTEKLKAAFVPSTYRQPRRSQHRYSVYRRSSRQLKNMNIFQLARYARNGQFNSATAEFNRRLNQGAVWRRATFNAVRIARFNAWVRNAA